MLNVDRKVLTAMIGCVSFFVSGCGPTADTDDVVFPGEDWQFVSPESMGMDAAKVRAAADHVAKVSGELGSSKMLVVYKGRVVWAGDAIDEVGPIWSCTKSFTSICLGMAWDDGLVEPSDPAHKWWPKMAKQYPDVTIQHLATFTGGVDVGGFKEGRIELGEPLFEPGTKFRYSRESDLLMAILTKASGKPMDQKFHERIGSVIGIDREQFQWGYASRVDGMGVSNGSGAPPTMIKTNARTFARVGWLMANGGVWDGKRLLSERYVAYATRPHTTAEQEPHDPDGWYKDLPGNYGLNWWTNGGPMRTTGQRLWPHAPASTFAFQGNKNNNCFVVPEWDMVVVRLGGDKIIDMRDYDRMFELLGAARDGS